MKIQNTKQKNIPKKIIIATALVGFLLLSSIVYVYAFDGSIFGWSKQSNNTVNDQSIEEATDDQKQTGEQIKEGSIENQDTDTKPSGVDAPTPPVKQDTGKSVVSVSISAANQTQSSLQIRTGIGVVTSSGTCTLNLSQVGKVITRTSNVQALPSTSTCEGFDIPLSELPTGKWTIDLLFENDTLTGSVTRDIEIK